MAFTLNRRLAQLVDSNGQLNTGKIPNDYITSDHVADNTITSAMLHTSFTVSTSNLTAIDTDDVSEGSTNLYFTNARVDTEIDSYLSGGTGVTYSSGEISIGQDVGTTATPTFGNITTTGYIAGPATFTIDPAAVGDNTGTVVIAGNLQVDGTTTTINSTTVNVDDLNIQLATGAANAAAANGAGITVDGANATINYNGTLDTWEFNKELRLTTGSFASHVNGNRYIKYRSTYDSAIVADFELKSDNNSAAVARITSTGIADVLQVFDNTTQVVTIADGGNVGIGTDQPNQLLHLDNSTNTTDSAGIRIISGTEGNARILFGDSGYGSRGRLIYSNSDDSLQFWGASSTTSEERMRIDSSGNVGIGDTNPSEALSVSGNIEIIRTAPHLDLMEDGVTDSNHRFRQNAGNLYIQKLSDDKATATDRIVLDGGTGNVGIGTDSSNSPLEIVKNITFTNSDTFPQLLIKTTATTTGNQLGLGVDETDNVAFIEAIDRGNNVIPLVLQRNAGRVGIGVDNPSTILQVGDGTTTEYITIDKSTTGESGILFKNAGNNKGKILLDSNENLQFYVNNTVNAMAIFESGNVGIGGDPDSSGRLLVQNGGTNQIVLTNNDSATTNLNMGNFGGGGYISQNYYYSSGHQADDNTKGAFEIFIGDDLYGINYHSPGAYGTRRRDIAITSAGNVGMGTNNPAFASGSGLEIERAGIATLRFQNTSSSKSVEITQDSDFKIESMNSASDILLMPTANVGIGTTNPLNKLHVDGDVHIGDGEDYSSYAKLAVYGNVYQGDVALLIKNDRYNDSTATASLIFEHRTHAGQGHAAKIVCRRQSGYNESAGSKDAALDFYTANGGTLARHMVLNRSGQFGVGNNDTFDAYAHHVIQSDNDQKVLDIKQNNSTGRVLGLQYIPNGPDDTTDYYMVCSDSNTNDMFVFSNGNVANKNNSYGSSSDIKIKQNITDANSQWNDIKALQFKNYKLKTDVARYGEDNADTLLGLIAQDVETAGMNGLVYESKDEDSEGNKLDTVTKGVKYSVLYLKAVKALQEAIVKIEDLESRLDEAGL